MIDIISFRNSLIKEIREAKRNYSNYYRYFLDFEKEEAIYKVKLTQTEERVEILKNNEIVIAGSLKLLPTDILLDIYFKINYKYSFSENILLEKDNNSNSK